MKRALIIFFVFLLAFDSYAQNNGNETQGTVSFASTQNIYVKFRSTSGISAGDTLFIMSGKSRIPALKVKSLSSTSCVCTTISSSPPANGVSIIAIRKSTGPEAEKTPAKEVPVVKAPAGQDSAAVKPLTVQKRKQLIRGSISAFAYSNFSNTPVSNSNQFRYNLSLDARNIGNSRFSAESYISFRHKAGEWNEVKNNIFNALKIYNLSVSFAPDKSSNISLGRKINPEISGIGASDGIQAEKSFNKFYIGGLAGFRPDYTDYGFNFNLFQYGGWLGFCSAGSSGYFRNTLAVVQQMNGGKTDRRFLSFYHSSSLANNLSILGSFEVDLYELKDSLPNNVFNLTSLYFSVRYRITKNFSLSGSYDSRKNVIYYETYKSSIDLAMENEMRKSFRLGANYRFTDDIALGLESGYRFLNSDPQKSINFNGYLSYYRIPFLNISTTVSAAYLESSYINSKTIGANISKDLFKGMLQLSGGYRYMNYSLTENVQNSVQHTGELNLYWLFLKTMSFSINYELTYESSYRYNRLYLQLRKRF